MAPAVEGDLLGVGGAAVDVEAEGLGGGGPARVAQADPGVEAAAPGLDGEAAEAPVRRPGTYAAVVGVGREELLLLVGEPAVGEEDEAHRRARRLHALGQVEGGGEVGRAGGGADGVEGGGESVGVGAGGEDDPGLGVGHHHAGHATRRELSAQVTGLVLGHVESFGVAVGGGHRPGGVDDEHGVLSQPGRGGTDRLGHGRGQEGDGQELGREQRARPELLPRRGHRHRPGHRPPQERRAHLHRRPRRRMCSTTIGIANSPSHNPAGLANLTAARPPPANR